MATTVTRHHLKNLVFGVLLLAWSPAHAKAECVGFSLEHYRQHADLVFSGTIHEVQQMDSRRKVVSFDVDRVWKGDVGRRIVLHHALEGIDSFRFAGAATGAKYLVFATRLDARQRQVFELSEGQDAFGIPLCGGGTHKIDANDTMLRQLGPGRAPGTLRPHTELHPTAGRIAVPPATGATMRPASAL